MLLNFVWAIQIIKQNRKIKAFTLCVNAASFSAPAGGGVVLCPFVFLVRPVLARVEGKFVF